MNSSFWFDTINFGWSNVYIKGAQVIISKYSAAFHLGYQSKRLRGPVFKRLRGAVKEKYSHAH